VFTFSENGRSSDLLFFHAFPSLWQRSVASIVKAIKELTAAGTVTDFHRIPYYSSREEPFSTTKKVKKIYSERSV
jgi:hypothetical protein